MTTSSHELDRLRAHNRRLKLVLKGARQREIRATRRAFDAQERAAKAEALAECATADQRSRKQMLLDLAEDLEGRDQLVAGSYVRAVAYGRGEPASGRNCKGFSNSLPEFSCTDTAGASASEDSSHAA